MNVKAAHLTEADDLLAKAAEAASFLRGLAHEHRLAILCTLAAGPLCVGDIGAALGMAQPKVSQHLMRLRAEGLVATERDGTSIYYRIASKPALEIAGVLKKTFCPPKKRR
ncbi:ArsR/SmtB family transcription factor [Dongia rigui]|uniref:Metalloregulator ArsR/SmtB family transcription factor n=1 Tax=Dongia rigui TaxID=940149 RepID=A0ABU5DY57_9PROT|nr:metalloregulator ArsR/SmtB family transcription factor [Dongia rigui]MDY0872230.1 metalloregulator ArsR/SmtB family transcription factor [Dongia rigui]